MEKIKVMLVDDQPLFAQSLKTFLENYASDIVVVGLAENGSKAVELALDLAKSVRAEDPASGAPDVVLMDVHMPIMNGVEATRRLRSYLPETKIIMLSTYDEDEYVRDALKEGASGYLLKRYISHRTHRCNPSPSRRGNADFTPDCGQAGAPAL